MPGPPDTATGGPVRPTAGRAVSSGITWRCVATSLSRRINGEIARSVLKVPDASSRHSGVATNDCILPYGNTLPAYTIGLRKTELIRPQRPLRKLSEVEPAISAIRMVQPSPTAHEIGYVGPSNTKRSPAIGTQIPGGSHHLSVNQICGGARPPWATPVDASGSLLPSEQMRSRQPDNVPSHLATGACSQAPLA